MTKTIFAVAGLAVLLFASPAGAVSMDTAQVGTIFCIGRLSGDMAPVLAILTDELRALVDKEAAKSGPDAIKWTSSADFANTCEPVGATGTFEGPEAVLAYGFREAEKPGFSDSLVLRFVNQQLRIDDIKFGSGGTLRQQLAGQ